MVGVLWLSWLSFKIVRYFVEQFHAFVLAPWGILRTNLKKYGEWAGEPIYPISLTDLEGGVPRPIFSTIPNVSACSVES